MTKTPERTKHWQEECTYISLVADKGGLVREMNHDRETFVRYCEMQRDTATREGYDDTATYIQHILDDLKAKP